MFSHCCEGCELHIRLPSLGIQQKGLGIPRESDFEGQWDLITGLPQDWGWEAGWQILHSWRAQTKYCVHQDQGKGTVTPKETEPDLTASVGEFLVEAWVSSGSPLR